MIIRSFYRKKNSKIYMMIFVTLFLTLLLVNAFIGYLKDDYNKSITKTTLLYVQSENDLLPFLTSDMHLDNIEKSLLVEYNDYNDININLNLKKGMLTTYLLDNKVLMYSDNILSDNEIIIFLDNLNYVSNDNVFEDITKYIVVEYLDKQEKFYIKDIKKANNYSYIKISNDTFDKLYNSSHKYNYTANINDNSKYQEIYQKYNQIAERCIFFYANDEELALDNIKAFIDTLNIFNHILIVVLVVVVLVTTKNIISDMQKNISLEYKLGFKKKKIKINILKRLISLHLLSFAIALMLYLISIIFISITLEILLKFKYMNVIYIVFIFILISDLLLCIMFNNKNIH